ncbi:uncharacterized protein LOC111395038 [Olea europaea var. sylvestris]|uniref:uncharacterized protein LOC111395038 n=1 Tax=Olea europaea var. sylvestris TaxID=158386 RepID=UPI000C1D39C5|nr:uncharacterized protein LOC111395038 [Olea europaea var. sylvestris]
MKLYVSTAYYTSSLSSQLSANETLTRNNYIRWKGDVEIALGLLDLDFAMQKKKLDKPTNKSNIEYVVEYEKWKRANKLCLKIIKRSISDSIKGAFPNNKNAKVETEDLMDKLMSMRCDVTSCVTEHVMKMTNISSELKALKIFPWP